MNRNDADTDFDPIKVLKGVYEKVKPNLPWHLVEQCYHIERDLQYEHDRDVAVDRLRKVVSVHAELEFNKDLNK
jgi:hypothetical protein